ncbi:MAG: hypothetical protein P8M17_05615 [Saprospiraceae bacterium]|nr:hypothetical protein [Saprospiraceae bacterium]MDG1435661.1 hypothetical protein [Saprospiraceae bacterium]MDG2418448.1 hypothetical protein [Saprospiraceae bacterium]
MEKMLLIAVIFISNMNVFLANNGDSTSTENCKETTLIALIGEWSYTNFAYQIVDNIHACEEIIIVKNAFLKFQFDKNGTYSKIYGSGDNETMEVGNWDITDDNYSLILMPKNGLQSHFIKINKLEEESIELELNIQEAGLDNIFCTEVNVLNFSKNILPLNNSVIR